MINSEAPRRPRRIVYEQYLIKEKRIAGSPSQLRSLVANFGFPRPFKIGGRNAWDDCEVDDWIEERAAERTPAE